MNFLGRAYRCPVTDVTLAGIAADAAEGAVATAAIDEVTGQPVTAGGVAEGAALGGAGGAVGGIGSDTSSLGADVVSGSGDAALSDAGVVGGTGGTGAATSTLGDAAAAADGIPTVNVTAAAPATGGGLSDLLMPAAGAAPLAAGALAAGGGGSGAGAVDRSVGAPADSSGFLPATGASDISGLTPDLAAQFGIDTSSPISSQFTPTLDPSSGGLLTPGSSPAMSDIGLPDTSGMGLDSGGFGSDFMNWAKNPKNALTLGMLGISGFNALSKPKLPGAASTALGAAGPAVQQAEATIASGGTATPIWSQQKATIDAQIDQEIKNQTAAMEQTLANSGAGGKDSGIVQQQIATLTANLNVQREQMYAQAQQQNVNNAVSELTGSNQTLLAIANLQFQQENQARQSAAETAQLALELQRLQGPG